MSVCRSEAAEPARALDLDWEALRWRKLEWGALSHTTRKGTIPYLTVREAGRLDCAMTNCEARPHLVKSYKGMEPPSFDGHVYTGTRDVDDNAEHVALRWVMKRGINLRGFEIELEYNYGTVRGAGPVLVVLMSKGNVWHDMKLAKYFAARGKLTDLNAFQYGVRTALSHMPLVRDTSISSKH